jgi:hypothetical protein
MHVGRALSVVSFGLSEVREKRHGFSRTPTRPECCELNSVMLWSHIGISIYCGSGFDFEKFRFRSGFGSGSVEFGIQIRKRIQSPDHI